MKLRHHDLIVEFHDEWLNELGMATFRPQHSSYQVCHQGEPGRVFVVAISDIGPVRRNPGVALLREDSERGISAKDRVQSILRAFQAGVPLPPVEVVEQSAADHRFKLTAGVHRLYSSLAVGFTHIPAIEGYVWEPIAMKDQQQ